MHQDIDYSLKIQNFKAFTETHDDDLAIKYLSENDWDEGKAAEKYFENFSRTVNEQPEPKNVLREEPREVPPSRDLLGNLLKSVNNMFNLGSNTFGPRFTNTNIYVPTTQHRSNIQENRPSSLSPKQKVSKNELLNFLPCKANTYDDFHMSIKTNIGMLFLYRDQDLDFLIHIIEILLNSDPDIMMILEHQFVTYSLEDSSKEAQSILKKQKLTFPSVLFMCNPFDLDKSDPNIIIDTLSGKDKLNSLTDAIYKALSLNENLSINNSSANQESRTSPRRQVPVAQSQSNLYDYQDYQNYGLEEDNSHGSIINKQREELKRLEKEEEDKNKKLKLEQQLKLQKEKEEKLLLEKKLEEEKQIANMKLFKKKQLPVEPPSSDPNSTNILFRYPDGVNRCERRFFKKDTIRDLYKYVECLENVEFNNHEGKFELIQTFPFALFSDHEKSIEEEKLFPNAVVQIREKDQ